MEVVEEVVVEVPDIVEDVEDNVLELEHDDENEDDPVDPVYLNIVIVQAPPDILVNPPHSPCCTTSCS